MIRIDEIYCNTFLPIIQDRPRHGMHWFDPFGSVKFDDLCNVPPMDDTPDSVRYLFWDQEPLHCKYVDTTLSNFTSMFPQGKRHLITSEYRSKFVDYACDTYGFQSHYYFFHGWAALDWFRGYNRSFLIAEPVDRVIEKTFISPNRIVAGSRQHRLIMLYHIFKLKMTNNWLSCPAVCPGEMIDLIDAIKPLGQIYPDMQQVFEQESLPINFPNETQNLMSSARLDLFPECANSLLYLVTETVASGDRQHLTEKSFKPICLRMPFITVGCAGSLEYLRKYGFRTFGDLWDESYDNEVDDHRRYVKIAMLIKELDSLSIREKQHLYDSAKKICEHNFNHFYHGQFEQVLWQELVTMIDNF